MQIQHRVETAYILAGGRSTRFGSNKALVEILGEPLVIKLARELTLAGLNAIVVAQSDSDYAGLGIETIADGVDHAGPLAGLIAALSHASANGQSACVVCSCDTIEWRAEWLTAMESEWARFPCSSIVVLGRESFSPLPGIYRTDLLEVANRGWQAGNRSLRGLHEVVGPDICRVALPAASLPKTFNSQEELRLLLEKGMQN